MKKRTKRNFKILIAAVLTIAMLSTTAFAATQSGDKSNSENLEVYKEYPDTIRQLDLGKGPKLCFSSNEEVATINNDGEITFSETPGESKIDVYRLRGKDKHLEFIVHTANKQILIPAHKEYEMKCTDDPIDLNVSTISEEGNKITYLSDNEKVVTVTEDGTMEAISSGCAKITVHAEESQSYYEADLVIPVSVEKTVPELEVETDSFEISLHGANDAVISAKSDSDGKITYKSEDTKVADVDENGNITPKDVGETTIIVEQEETKKYAYARHEVYVSVTKPTASDRAQGAIKWARMIAEDNSFAYGTGQTAHRAGCYFCGTNYGPNKYKKAKGYEKTYCCNTFVFSAYAHGAELPDMLKACKDGRNSAWGEEWKRYGFENLGKIDYEDMLPGDVLTSSGHMWMMTDPENDKYIDATGGTWKDSSIQERTGAKKRYAKAKFVLRYKGE